MKLIDDAVDRRFGLRATLDAHIQRIAEDIAEAAFALGVAEARPVQEPNVVKEFRGTDIENQRLRVTVEHWSEFTGDFVHVFHSHGDDSITDMVFTDAEGWYLLTVLKQIYTGHLPAKARRQGPEPQP